MHSRQPLRIGVQIEPNDSFWIQIDEALHHCAERLGNVELVPIEVNDPITTAQLDERGGLDEELLAQEIRALICKDIQVVQFPAILSRKLPIIYLAETDLEQPLFTSPRGLYKAARLVGLHLAEKLGGKGHILCIGGLTEPNADDGRTRLAGFYTALQNYPGISCQHIPTAWSQGRAKEQIAEALQTLGTPFQAVFGLSDTLALATREIIDELGLEWQPIYIAGINGDPLALAAIAQGKMALTVETPASEFAQKALELAVNAARGEGLPEHYSIEPQLITPENVNTVALQKLIAIADIPSRLVGVNHRQEQNRLIQLETSAEIR